MRVLTSEEKQNLAADTTFINKCTWAVRDYAAYWAVHSGTGLTDELRIKWVKDRLNSIPIVLGDINDPSLGLKFSKLAKGMEFDLDTAPVESSVIIAAMVASNKFEELSSLYFDLLGENINFAVSGN